MTDTAIVHTPAPRPLTNSPWGLIQQVTQIAEGIWQVSTAYMAGSKSPISASPPCPPSDALRLTAMTVGSRKT